MVENNIWDDMQRKMNRMFCNFSPREREVHLGFDDDANYRKAWVNLKEDEKNFILVIELPGIGKEDIKVNITDTTVEIKAENKKQVEKKDEERQIYGFAKTYSGFYRSFELPSEADTKNLNAIQAKHENGVLTLKIPKKKTPENKKEIRIE